MKKLYNYAFALLAFIFTISATAQRIPGVVVLNEGNAGTDNSNISFIAAGEVHNDIYSGANDDELGNTAQSMAFDGDKAYVVLNGSNALKVLNRYTLELQTVVAVGLANPRFMVTENGKGYITCWGDAGNTEDDYVAVIDLTSLNIDLTIPAPEGVERIIKSDGKLFVANQGGYGYGNTVSVIDIATNSVTATINTGDVPNSIIAQDGVLYVLCGGKPSWSGSETSGKLVKYNLADYSLIREVAFEGKHPSNLEIYGDYLIFSIDTDVYKITLNDTTLPENPLFSVDEVGVYGIYGMDIIGDKIYVADAGDYIAPGRALIYTVDGELEMSYTVGRLPNGFYEGEIQLLATENQNPIATVSVYPNPTADRFFINTDQQAAIKMYDISGRLVKATTYKTSGIEISDLNSGIYVVEIKINDQKSIKRLSVN